MWVFKDSKITQIAVTAWFMAQKVHLVEGTLGILEGIGENSQAQKFDIYIL